ncbi:DUF4234 domain-containing protein [Kribbella sp. NPDC000426]|uniref:DUF4234 domain-containing protein n=1 Tax=Kribbella sp. NPDC000426 TaxID=3154255 RepID=UPI00332D122C
MGQHIVLPSRASTPVGHGLQMKLRRPVRVWLLAVVTVGIYHLVWYYKIHRELARFDRRRAVPVAGPMLVLLLLGWTVVAPLVSYFRTGKRIGESQRAAGLPVTCNPLLGMLLMLVFGLGAVYLQVELNKVVNSYGDAPAGVPVSLYV